ncbi:NAD-dependent epimerase/dehydratase family protein [Bacillus rubiinfantis]|uniref:NAD-dependent epimerase/dehydratase family protein n=1 Tax=Bacillus rubiinfantis TaxID=1499680 RepID=UPI0005A5EFD1|nr:NAD-dependent epimerase/dehydratase family protein [Bacillus rubiinfantis]
MKVLVTGGYGFIGSFVAERFYREGHEVHILDNLSTGSKNNVQFRHRSYILNVEDPQCEQVFRTHKFDAIIHLAAQVDVQTSIHHPLLDAKMNVMGLVNMLQLCQKYGVSQFTFASSAAVYGDNPQLPLNENAVCDPFSPYGINKKLGEYYCQKWMDLYQVDTLCFRFSNVYGPKQSMKGEGGVVSAFIGKILCSEKLIVYGDGNQTRDFIYVEDVAEAIYRAASSRVTGLMNLSTNTGTSVNQLIEQFKNLADIQGVVYKPMRNGDILHSRLDNQKVKREVDWTPKYSIEEGLKITFNWFKDQAGTHKQSIEENEPQQPAISSKKHYLPYFETIFLFIIAAGLHIKIGNLLYNIDILLLYILTIAIIFGKTQAVIACGLSVILYSWSGIVNGREMVALFTDHNTLLHFAIYLLVGFLVGYIIDRKHIREEMALDELQLFKEKYELLDEIYSDTRKAKEELQTQILLSEDSVGAVYSVIKKLDSLEPDEVFNGVISTLEQIMKTNQTAIYMVGQKSRYLRLVSKSKGDSWTLPASIEIIPDSPFAAIVLENKSFINRKLDPNVPMMMAPIWKNDRAIAVICVNGLSFEQLTLYYDNLFHVVTNLITASIGRAYDYVNATHHERYIEGTNILKPTYFHRALGNKQKAKEQFNIPYSLIQLVPIKNMNQLLTKFSATLRETDYIGLDENGVYWMLLSNTNAESVGRVMDRFKSFIDQHSLEEKIYA